MAKIDYNRYSLLNNNSGVIKIVPLIKLPTNSTDKFISWNVMSSRYDKLSDKYYGNPFYDILISCANTEFVSEYDIPDGTIIRIPFPFSKAKNDYETLMQQQINK